MNTINKNLKELRTKKGMTQQQLANELFVTRQCISRWEQGKTLPDVINIEKISKIFDCTINDLIDDNSIKSLTIEEAINNKKNKKIMWIAFCISIAAVIGSLFSILNHTPSEVDAIILDDYYGYVIEIDYDSLTMTLEKYETKELVYLDFLDVYVDINDNRGYTTNYDEINLFDKLHVNEQDLNDYNITIIDSLVEEELFGVYISPTGDNYQSLDEIKSDYEAMYVMISDGSSSSRTMQGYNYDYVTEDLYRESIYDIYIFVNPLEVQDEIEIGLITSNGVKITDTIDVSDMQSMYTYKGEYNLHSSDEDYIDNYNVTFNIHFQVKYSYSTLEIYEYDKNNDLINETIISDLNELRDFEAHIDSLYCLLAINTTLLSNESNDLTNSEVHKLYLGESIEVYQSDNNGMVFTEWFTYKD
jgi:transcriptional regulator with XRE-family HTH domain